MSEKELKLKVAEAIQDDVNKGVIRIDSSFLNSIGVRPGDIVELEGERKTVALTDRAYPGDIGLNIVRMDGIIRKNSKTGIGEIIKVRKADVKEGKKITIAPARKGIIIKASPEIFKHGLLGRAVTKGDIVSLGGTRRRRSTMMDSPFFEDTFPDLMADLGAGFGFGDIKFIVVDTSPKQPIIISEQTDVEFNPEAVEVKDELVPEVTYEDIGGLDEEVKKVREMVELPLKHPEIFERLGIEAPKGVLLHGSPGTGKTLLAKAVANETNSHFILINGPEIMSKYYGQSEENLRKKFEEAEKHAPSIIFIDEIDAIASKREDIKGEVERRVVAQLLAVMDGLKSRGKVVVIAATNVPNILDPALRRPGRFDREIEIGVPGKEGRLNILKIHTRNMPLFTKEFAVKESKGIESEYKEAILGLLKYKETVSSRNLDKRISNFLKDNPEKNDLFKKIDTTKLKKYIDKISYNRDIVNLKELADITYGFVGADLASLAKEAAMIVLRKIFPDLMLQEEQPISKEVLEKLRITQQDFKEALKVVRPSALREVLVEVPNVKWADVGGLEGVKQELIEAVEWPLKYPDSFKRLGVRPPKGILLYGAPGTGKTLLAKAVANESQSNFILVKGPELLSMWVGESEKAVREVFKKARQVSPCIIFFDEIDSLAPKRGLSGSDGHTSERVVNQLLTEIDGLEEMRDVVVIAATNRPDIVDTSLLRPGRFDRMILTSVPDEKTRLEIFKVHTKGMPLSITEEEIEELDSKFKDTEINNVNIASKMASDEPIKDSEISKSKNKVKKQVKNFKDLPDIEKLLHSLASKTEGYAGADIESVCREAAILALRESMDAKEITSKHFDKALEKVPASIDKDVEKSYEAIRESLSSARAKEMNKEKPVYMG